MSTPVRPSTPERKEATPSTPLTGTWRHPQLDEIARRQNATTFSEKNFKKVLWNVGTLVSLYFVEKAFISWFPGIYIKATKYLNPYSTYTYWSIVLVILGNIILACLPLFRAKDDLSDIALTPAQRKLLGLPPSSAPPTPGSQYATPPRYQRTSTPLSGSPASQRSHSNSPLSGRGSPSGSISGIPFSPNASPMLQRAFGGNSNGARRSSYGSPSPLGPSSRSSIGELPGTPTPAASKGSSVGLNNRWLFEKGRRNSGSSRLYT